jgi:hypothetical protein
VTNHIFRSRNQANHQTKAKQKRGRPKNIIRIKFEGSTNLKHNSEPPDGPEQQHEMQKNRTTTRQCPAVPRTSEQYKNTHLPHAEYTAIIVGKGGGDSSTRSRVIEGRRWSSWLFRSTAMDFGEMRGGGGRC